MSTPPFVALPAGVTAHRWPVRGTERAVLTAGFVDTGFVDGGDWVLLIPGFTGSKEDFIAVLPGLAQAGYGVVAYDQLGQHESAGTGRAEDYSLELLAADIGELAASVGERFGTTARPHLVGHSLGGLVCQAAVAGGVVRPSALVLLCSGPGALPAERWQGLPDLVAALENTDLATIWRITRAMEQAEDVAPPPPAVAAFLERRWHANDPAQLRAFAELLMSQPSIIERLHPMLDDVPVTVMWGAADDAWPISVQQAMADDLGADSVELPGVGHSPNSQDPELLVDALLRAWAR